MKPLIPNTMLTAALIALCLLPRTLYANGPQVLLLDGKVRTKGISFEGVRMVVERNGIPVQVVMEDLGHFQLQLDLQQDYVLIFHRESCLSKSLHIDTHVPEHTLDLAPFRFPLLVTLEPRPKGPVVRYAEPVGQIYFMEGKADFGYGTDYTLTRERKEAALANAHRSHARQDPTTPSSTENAARKPSVNVPAIKGPSQKDSSLSPLRENRWAARSLAEAPANEEPRLRQTATADTPLYATTPDGRTEELEVRPTYVAKEVRITENGRTAVYRRVTHRYGAVLYFCNGSGCSETSFLSAMRH